MVMTVSSSSPSNKDVIYVSSDEEEDTAEWLPVLLQTKFWRPCKDHWEEHRGEMSMLCLNCYEVVCPHCRHDEPGHRLLKVRRYAYRSVILVMDMHELDLDTDVSGIQTYNINNQKGVHLRPVRRSPRFRPGQWGRRCSTCYVWLRHEPFCSLACKENADTSLGDFSETEADRKHRQHSQATVEPSPYRIMSVVLALAAPLQPIEASPPEDQRDTDVPEAEHGYEQVIVDVPKPPSPTLQQPETPLALVAESSFPQQFREPPAPAVEAPSPQQPEEAPVADQYHFTNHPVSTRRRPRKMKHPVRAPFF